MPRRRLVSGAPLALALVLAGCGSSTNELPETLTAATSHGLSYMLLITSESDKQCTTATYTATAGGGPIKHTSRLCGKPAVSGHPILIQAQGSSESLLVDVPKDGCGKVLAGPGPPRCTRSRATAPRRCRTSA